MESLLAYTDSNTQPEEYEQISRALERAREILAYVNTAVQEAENSQRLSEIHRKLDQSSLAKNKHGHSDELRGVSLSTFRRFFLSLDFSRVIIYLAIFHTQNRIFPTSFSSSDIYYSFIPIPVLSLNKHFRQQILIQEDE